MHRLRAWKALSLFMKQRGVTDHCYKKRMYVCMYVCMCVCIYIYLSCCLSSFSQRCQNKATLFGNPLSVSCVIPYLPHFTVNVLNRFVFNTNFVSFKCFQHLISLHLNVNFLLTVGLKLKVKLYVKVNLSLCFNWAPRQESVLGKWRYSSTHSWPWH